MRARPRAARHAFLLAWVPVLAYVLLIAILSSYPQPQVASLFSFQDKFLHLGEYGVLGLLMARAMAATARGEPSTMTYAGGVAWGSIVALGDEIYQASTPGRSSSPADLVVDVVALCAAAGVYCFVRTRSGRARAAGT
jgi:VanZ family protein